MWERVRGPWLLRLCLLLWAGDAVPILPAVGVQPDPGLRPNGTNTSNTTTQGDKARTDGGYNTVPGSEQTMMIQRALCVLVVVTALVVIYFVVRTIRMRRINRKNRKYGILKTNMENMEMRPLDQEDEEEDDTLFDVHHSRR